jgi:hypothetical protein
MTPLRSLTSANSYCLPTLKGEVGALTIPGRLKIFSMGEPIVTGHNPLLGGNNGQHHSRKGQFQEVIRFCTGRDETCSMGCLSSK